MTVTRHCGPANVIACRPGQLISLIFILWLVFSALGINNNRAFDDCCRGHTDNISSNLTHPEGTDLYCPVYLHPSTLHPSSTCWFIEWKEMWTKPQQCCYILTHCDLANIFFFLHKIHILGQYMFIKSIYCCCVAV